MAADVQERIAVAEIAPLTLVLLRVGIAAAALHAWLLIRGPSFSQALPHWPLFLALAAIHLAHLAAVRNEGWGTTADRFALAYVAGNLRVNGRFFLGDARFPIACTLLATTGLVTWRGAGSAVSLLLLEREANHLR